MPDLVPPWLPSGTLTSREQPVLVVGGLTLRPYEVADAPAVLLAHRDPEIRRWHVRTMTTEDEAAAWTASRTARWAAGTGAEWAVEAGGAFVGRVGFGALHLGSGSAGVTYWVVPAARRRGVAAAALGEMTRWALGDLGLHRLELDHSTQNPASCGVALAAGYALEGTRRLQGLHADGWHDMHLHARVAG